MSQPRRRSSASCAARLDAFGDRLQAERVGEAHDGGDDGAVVRVAASVEAVDEGAVDLQQVDREAPQVAERRVAGAEVVDRELHAEIA